MKIKQLMPTLLAVVTAGMLSACNTGTMKSDNMGSTMHDEMEEQKMEMKHEDAMGGDMKTSMEHKEEIMEMEHKGGMKSSMESKKEMMEKSMGDDSM